MPSPIPIATEPTADGPPVVVIEVGAVVVRGIVGSYTLPDGGEDAPWLPASTLGAATVAATPGHELAVSLDGPGIAAWSAVAARAADRSAARKVPLGEDDDAGGVRTVRIVAPPAGEWVVMTHLSFVGGRGDVSVYWRVVVR